MITTSSTTYSTVVVSVSSTLSMVYELTTSTLVKSFLSAIATIIFCSFGLLGYWTTTVVWTLFYEVFVTADTTSVDLDTVLSSIILFTTLWIAGVYLITFTSLVVTTWVPVTESIVVSVEESFVLTGSCISGWSGL